MSIESVMTVNRYMHTIYNICFNGFILVTYYSSILHIAIYINITIKRVVLTWNLISLETYLFSVLYYGFD